MKYFTTIISLLIIVFVGVMLFKVYIELGLMYVGILIFLLLRFAIRKAKMFIK